MVKNYENKVLIRIWETCHVIVQDLVNKTAVLRKHKDRPIMLIIQSWDRRLIESEV